MIYTGGIEKHTVLDDEQEVPNPQKKFMWFCSCTDREEGIETYQEADRALDRHMRKHFREGQQQSEPQFCTGDRVECTETGMRGNVTDPHVDGVRILVFFDNDHAPIRHPVDTLRRVIERRVDPIIAVEGVPNYITRNDRVQVCEGSWSGKIGTVTCVDLKESEGGGHEPSSYVMVQFDGEDGEYPVKACTLAPLDAHTHEDDQDAIERPPKRDASHDAQRPHPIDQGTDESDQTKRLIAIIDAPINPGVGTMRYVTSRLELFSDNELVNLNQALVHLSCSCTDHRGLLQETQKEMYRRNVPLSD